MNWLAVLWTAPAVIGLAVAYVFLLRKLHILRYIRAMSGSKAEATIARSHARTLVGFAVLQGINILLGADALIPHDRAWFDGIVIYGLIAIPTVLLFLTILIDVDQKEAARQVDDT